MSEHIDTGLAGLSVPTSSPEAAVSAPVETATSVETIAPAVAAAPPAPHPQGPSVAEILAAKSPEQHPAEAAFDQPITVLAPAEHMAPRMIIGDDQNAVAQQTAAELRALQSESPVARSNREIYERIMAARNAPPAVPVPQPVAARITEQTRAEMAEGQRLSAIHAERQRTIPRNKPSAREIAASGTSTPVFRPTDFVPDQMKGQGDVRAQPVIR